MDNTPLREKLADLCHQQWSGWMAYLFSRSTENPDGTITIPTQLANRWNRQRQTDYTDLEPSEQNSDRNEADKFILLIANHSLTKLPNNTEIKTIAPLTTGQITHPNLDTEGYPKQPPKPTPIKINENDIPY